MSKGIVLAWAAGMGLITWRGIRQDRKPVPAGRYLAATGVYAMLGMLAAYQPAAGVANLLAWGFNLGAWMGMYPEAVVPAKAPARPQTAKEAHV